MTEGANQKSSKIPKSNSVRANTLHLLKSFNSARPNTTGESAEQNEIEMHDPKI